jgi:hypothetical protein
MYRVIRNIHLLLASLSLPFLIMYGVSAVQMSHSTWFTLKPVVRERDLTLGKGLTDARAIGRTVMDRAADVKGELSNIQSDASTVSLRIVVPGTVHEVRYDPVTGLAHVKTSVAGVMGMLNRLHHWAGFWHEPMSMRLWAAAVAIVSTALLLLGISGIYMWFTRRAERRLGVALLAINLLVAVTLIGVLRSHGP